MIWLLLCGIWAQASVPPTQLPGRNTPKMAITQVPYAKIVVPKNDAPLPYPHQGLAFQTGVLSGGGPQLLRPIGDARFTKQGLVLTFPDRQIMLFFEGETYESRYLGTKRFGGKDEPINTPDRLYVGEDVRVTSRSEPQLTRLGKTITHTKLPVNDVYPGPNDAFIVVSTKNPNAMNRMDIHGRTQQQYLLHQPPELPKPTRPARLHILPDWRVIAVRRDGGLLYDLMPTSALNRLIAFDFGQTAKVHAVRFAKEHYWLLVETDAVRLLCVDTTFKVQGNYRLDFPADGFDISDARLLLYNKSLGVAKTYRRQ